MALALLKDPGGIVLKLQEPRAGLVSSIPPNHDPI